MKRIWMVILAIMMALVLVGCFPAIKVEKFSQAQIANDPTLRPMSPVGLFNRYEASCVQVFAFRGNLSNDEMYFWARGNRLILMEDRLVDFFITDHKGRIINKAKEVWLEPAFSDRDPAEINLLFYPSRAITFLGIIRGGGKARNGPLYRIERRVVYTTKDPFRDTRTGLERVGTTFANRIVEFSGTNVPILDKLSLHINIYPNQKVRDWLRR